MDSFSRVYLMGGKLANASGEAVANDVYVATLTSTTPPTLSWSQASASAPFTPRDGPAAASYFSTPLNLDVLYFSTGYDYTSAVAQANDNGVGTQDVWVSTTQGTTWTLLSSAAFPPRYHAKMLATQAGVLLMLAGANAPPPTNGGASQGAEYVLNDLYASLDGGYSWGQCSAQIFPPYTAAVPPSQYALGTGREDPVLAIDVATGFVYTGMGLQRTPTGGAASPQDLFRTSISFYDTPAVAGLCNLTQPTTIGLQTSPTPLATGTLCLIFYGLPGNVDYPWSSATSVTFTYNPAPVVNGFGTAISIVSGGGNRTYTNRFGDKLVTPVTISPSNVQGSDNLLYLGSSYPVDIGGITLLLPTYTQLPGNGPNSAALELNVYNAPSGGIQEGLSARIDNLGQAFLSNVPGFQNITIGASNVNSLAPSYTSCTAPITFTNGLRQPTQPSSSNGATRFTYSYFISDGATYSVVANLTISTTSQFAVTKDALGNPYQTVVNVTGTRLYTYLPAMTPLLSTVTGVAVGTFASADQRFYPYSLLASSPGVYSTSTAPFFDFNGIVYSVSPSVPVDGTAPGVGTQYNTVRLFFSTPITTAILTEARYNNPPLVSLQQQQYTLQLS